MLRALMLSLVALAFTYSGCSLTVTSQEPGTQNADGSVYLGFTLVTQKRGKDWFLIGSEYGQFTKIRIHVADRALDLESTVIEFAGGETWSPPLPARLEADSWTGEIALPGPRAIEKITFVGRARGKKTQFAKVELYGLP